MVHFCNEIWILQLWGGVELQNRYFLIHIFHFTHVSSWEKKSTLVKTKTQNVSPLTHPISIVMIFFIRPNQGSRT